MSGSAAYVLLRERRNGVLLDSWGHPGMGRSGKAFSASPPYQERGRWHRRARSALPRLLPAADLGGEEFGLEVQVSANARHLASLWMKPQGGHSGLLKNIAVRMVSAGKRAYFTQHRAGVSA